VSLPPAAVLSPDPPKPSISQADLDAEKKKVAAKDKEINQLTAELAAARTTAKSCQDDVKKLNAQVTELQTKLAASPDASVFKTQLAALESQLNSSKVKLETEVNGLRRELANATSSLESASSDASSLKAQVALLTEEKKILQAELTAAKKSSAAASSSSSSSVAETVSLRNEIASLKDQLRTAQDAASAAAAASKQAGGALSPRHTGNTSVLASVLERKLAGGNASGASQDSAISNDGAPLMRSASDLSSVSSTASSSSSSSHHQRNMTASAATLSGMMNSTPGKPAPLPSGWTEHLDEKTQKTFYYQAAKNLTQWDRPTAGSSPDNKTTAASVPPMISESAGASTAPSVSASNSSMGLSSSSSWQELTDTTTGKKYYYDPRSRRTSWTPPPNLNAVGAPPPPDAPSAPPTEAGGRPHSYSHAPTRSTSSLTVVQRGNNDHAVIVVHADDLPLPEVDDMERYSMIRYAEKNFQKQKKGLFDKQTVEEMVSHNKKALSVSLHKFPDKRHEEDALQTFKNITSYMGERKSGKAPFGHIDKLSRMGMKNNELLRDEILAQIVKQVTNNDNREAVSRGWRLLCILLGVFPPSSSFNPYLVAFCQNSVAFGNGDVPLYSRYALRVLDLCLLHGPRFLPPTKQEVEFVENRKPISFDLVFCDNTTRQLWCYAQTDVHDVVTSVASHFKLPQHPERSDPQIWGVYELVRDGTDNHKSFTELEYNMRMCDVMHAWDEYYMERRIDRTQHKMDFFFRARLTLNKVVTTLTGHALHIFFIQAVHDVVRSQHAIKNDDALKLAALQVQAYFGDEKVDIEKLLSDRSLKKFVPSAVVQQYTLDKNALRRKISTERLQLLGLSKDQAKQKYIDMLRELPTFGCTFYTVEQELTRGKEEVVLGVSERGLRVIHPITRQLNVQPADMKDIQSFSLTGNVFEAVVIRGDNAKTLTFKAATVKLAKTIHDLFEIYKQLNSQA
jgi:predicted  nucleic acid-binding Zn-ribbon protein/acyl-CoA-binding protein